MTEVPSLPQLCHVGPYHIVLWCFLYSASWYILSMLLIFYLIDSTCSISTSLLFQPSVDSTPPFMPLTISWLLSSHGQVPPLDKGRKQGAFHHSPLTHAMWNLPGKREHWWRVHPETVWNWLSEQTKLWCAPHDETQPGSFETKEECGAQYTSRARMFPETRPWAEIPENAGNCKRGKDLKSKKIKFY